MGSNNNSQINAAYVATWKQKNPKLDDLNTDGSYLICGKEKLDIRDIYMQDILSNPNIFYSIEAIESKDLFNIIKIHVCAIQIKEKELEAKVRRMKEYEYRNSY